MPRFISPAFPFLVAFLIVAGIGYYGYRETRRFLLTSKYFRVAAVDVAPSLSFIDPQHLAGIKGKSIFAVDLDKFQRKLAFVYPQAAHLKVSRRFPNRIFIQAKKRLPFVQAYVRNKAVLLDSEGVILSLGAHSDGPLPAVFGVSDNAELALGMALNDDKLRVALQIIKEIRANPSFSGYDVINIHVDNLLKIYFHLSNGLRIIVDQERIDQKIKLLAFVLAQKKIDLEQTKYIDLRFKEPVLGKK
jgi:cell division septal protein FtsQ